MKTITAECTAHHRSLIARSNGFLNNQPTTQVGCIEPGCDELRGPLCNECPPSILIYMRPRPAEPGEADWTDQSLSFFECAMCGVQTWRYKWEVDELQAGRKAGAVLMRRLFVD